MKNKYRIDRKNIPSKMPFTLTIVSILAMDYWSAPEWIFGAVGLFLFILWIGFFISIINTESVDIFKVDNQAPDKKNRFSERLEKSIKDANSLNN